MDNQQSFDTSHKIGMKKMKRTGYLWTRPTWKQADSGFYMIYYSTHDTKETFLYEFLYSLKQMPQKIIGKMFI